MQKETVENEAAGSLMPAVVSLKTSLPVFPQLYIDPIHFRGSGQFFTSISQQIKQLIKIALSQ
jgi:hypothetical protein